MEHTFDEAPRNYVIRRSQHVGYGFTAGEEWPTMVKKVESNGPSYDRLQPGDVIMAVNGIDVENVPREQIIKMIQLSGDQIEIKVRKLSYGELIRAKNLADPKFYQLNSKQHNTAGGITSAANQYSQQLQQQPQLYPHLHRGPPPPPPIKQQQQQQQQTAKTLQLASDNQWQFNRLVTSISEQHQQNLQHQQQQHMSSPHSTSDGDTPPVQTTYSTAATSSSKQILKQKSLNQSTTKLHDLNNNNNTSNTLKAKKDYGRFSPIPQRCKSSMDIAQGKNKKSNNEDNDLPLLKRRNTMRPIRPPPEVREILQVCIKIFFEGSHSRALKYNHDTTVGAILEILNERLEKTPSFEQVKSYFGLAITFGVESNHKNKTPKRKLLHVLDENDSIAKIGQLPYSHQLRLIYRMVYPPKDVYNLYKQSKMAFEYLYQQSCNDLKLEGFEDMDEDTSLKLSALHLLEYVYSNHSKEHKNSKDPKVYIKLIKKTRGIEYFVPASMAESVLDKDGKRIASQYKKLKAKLIKQLKKNFEEFNFEPPKVKSTTDMNRFSMTSFHELILPEMQSSPSDYIKLLFLNYLSQLSCYGNPKRPVKASTSPMEQTSSGDCSSSIESVPRTSDSLPLIKQDRNQINHLNNGTNGNVMNNNNCNPNISISGRPDNMNANTLTRLTQMNTMRSLSSVRSPSQSQSNDQPDMVATPSIDSVSSVTFNSQNSPSPAPSAAPTYLLSSTNNINNNSIQPTIVNGSGTITNGGTIVNGSGFGPSPMPRHQPALPPRRPDYNSIDKLYNQRYPSNDRYIDDLIRNMIILPPPPPPSSLMFDDLTYQLASSKAVNYHLHSSLHLTQVLSDKDIEELRCPPPPNF